jgi:NitT/TauT family transport system substrate-binding protein
MTRTPNLTRRGFLTASGATVAAIGAAGMLSACGGSSATAGGGRKVTAVLDVTPYGKHVPFYVGLERGYWQDRDLDVNFQSGKGSGDAVSKVASGAGDFALADTSVVALARGNQNQPVMVTCMYHYKNLMSELTLEGNGITEPGDLVGTTQHVTAGEGTFALLPALAQANKFDDKQVLTTVGEFTQIVPALLSGQVDGALTYYTLFPALQQAAEEQGKTATGFLYADNGIDVYNNGIVVTESFAEKDPEVVKAFNDGFVESVRWTAENPDEATEIFVKAVAGTNAKTARAQLQVALDHLNVPEVQKNGFGPMSLDKMETTLELVNEYFELTKPVEDVNKIFSNEFVTAGKVPAL